MYSAHAWAVSLSLAVLLSSLDVAVFLNACKYHHTRTHTGRFHQLHATWSTWPNLAELS